MTRITFPNPVTRTQITDGLRQLADYLHPHPDIPIASCPSPARLAAPAGACRAPKPTKPTPTSSSAPD
jgi:hypothetical protein